MDDDVPGRVLTPREYAKDLAALRTRLLSERPRGFPPGMVRKCPQCNRRTMASRDNLCRDVVNAPVVHRFHNLHGARCTNCGAELLEAYEVVILEEAGAQHFVPDYAARVANVTGKNLGTYWPKDVVRVMDLHAHDSLRVQVLDEDTMVLHRQHAHK